LMELTTPAAIIPERVGIKTGKTGVSGNPEEALSLIGLNEL
jgi:hypothetical protein